MRTDFQAIIQQKGEALYRDMPWRRDTRPYYILVSELMLQQTQVSRVIPKFNDFIQQFPDETQLAAANLADVLRAWQGLGYNRRAKFLHETAKMLVTNFHGRFPASEKELLKLPGVGKNTAGAIQVYSFNQPSMFIETNIRTVYIHHFFADDFAIDDKLIIEKLEQTLDREHPREFYWALMDYGAKLKSSGIKNIARSKHYKKQLPLEGSVRQVRGQIITQLARRDMSEEALKQKLNADNRFFQALASLLKDGLVTRQAKQLHLTK